MFKLCIYLKLRSRRELLYYLFIIVFCIFKLYHKLWHIKIVQINGTDTVSKFNK
jgi:hypothetical protein